MPASKHVPCDDILVLKEKVAALEAWRFTSRGGHKPPSAVSTPQGVEVTEADLKEIRDVISQVKLLITLSIGGGGLSIITLIITISRLINP